MQISSPPTSLDLLPHHFTPRPPVENYLPKSYPQLHGILGTFPRLITHENDIQTMLPTLPFFFLTLAHAAPSFNLNLLGTRTPSAPDSRRIPSPVQATPVLASSPPECTVGVPALQQGPNTTVYPIDGYTKVVPRGNETVSYGVWNEWDGLHYVSGPHVSFTSFSFHPSCLVAV
jgi:hypothetical protein